MTTQQMGQENFRWFIGIVEDVLDPLKLGRVKVRVLNSHDTVNTEDMPWAQVLMPPTSGSVHGVGDTPSLTIQSRVVGFFIDGNEMQMPIIMGSTPIIPDMDDDKHSLSYLARGKQTIEKEQIGAEPASAFAAEYPHNRVIQSRAGHVIEIDDTPENERLHIYHNSGTYIEMSKEGKMVIKANGDNYDITKGNKTGHVKGDITITIEGTANITCPTSDIKGDVNVDGNVKVTGTITADGEVTGNNIKLSTHTHTGVKAGSDNSGQPQ
jgi:hypothetical protein